MIRTDLDQRRPAAPCQFLAVGSETVAIYDPPKKHMDEGLKLLEGQLKGKK